MLWMSTVSLLSILAPFAGAEWTGPQFESIPGAETLLRPCVGALLGEIHGTEEAPETAARLVCQAFRRGLTVTVGLEFARAEQDVIDRYLASDGTAEDEGHVKGTE